MRFFEIDIKTALVYGDIAHNGRYSVCVWDFVADEYTAMTGYGKNARDAWSIIYSQVRKQCTENRNYDPDLTDLTLDLDLSEFEEA